VLTTLTAPASGILNIMFFVRGAENFEFANPAEVVGDIQTYEAPSFFALQSEDTTDLLPTQITIGTPAPVLSERYAQNFGECVGSLRNVLHRSVFLDHAAVPDTTNLFNSWYKRFMRMPYSPGFDPASGMQATKIVAAAGAAPYSFNRMSHICWTAGMFLGYRGSVNYTVTPSDDIAGPLGDVEITRSTTTFPSGGLFVYGGLSTNLAHGTTVASKANYLNRQLVRTDGLGGAALTSTRTNGSISFNLPDYNNFNFSLVNPTTYVNGSSADGTNIQNACMTINLKNPTAAIKSYTETLTIKSYVSAGPDFTCLFFLCCPTTYVQTVNATPV
jgi:hypothetical protein